ncbi:MAG TPA: PAS domain-containing protein [Cytophagaceae bacterium]
MYLSKYADFLLQNYIDDIAAAEYAKSVEVNVPLLKLFSHLSEREMLALTKKSIGDYLFQIVNGQAVGAFLQSMEDWRADRLPGAPRDKITVSDIVLLHNVRKHTLLHFMPCYTSDVNEVINILKEIEDYYTYQEKLSIQTFVELQEERLNEREQQLIQAQEIGQIGSFNWDFVNDRAVCSIELYRIFGWPLNKELNIDSFNELLHPDDKERVYKALQESIDKADSYDIEYKIVRADGSIRTLWVKAKMESIAEKPIRLKGTVVDVTERIQSQIEVQYRQAQLVEAQEIAHIGSFDWDFLNDTSQCTDELFRIFGWSSDKELNFKTFEELVHPEDLKKVFEALSIAIQNKGPYDCEYRIIRPNQVQRAVWAKGKVYFDNNGNATRLTGTILDITERKMAEEEIDSKNIAILNAYKKLELAQKELKSINSDLEERVRLRTLELEESILDQKRAADELKIKNHELKRINADLDNFIYTASHDLKAPISNIEGLVITLSEILQGTPIEEVHEILQMINTSISRFGTTIQDLTHITKVHKEIIEDIQKVNIEDLLEEVISSMRPMVMESKADLEISLQVKEIRFSKKNLRSIIYNLLSNSIKYRSDDRPLKVNISSGKKDGYMVLSVKDNGLGIPREKHHRIFTMFKRLHDHVDGSGIGLYIVKRIVDNAGGKIELEGDQGIGSTFKIYFKEPL